MSKDSIRPITMEHIQRYGDIYAKAFSGEPWNDPWKTEDAPAYMEETRSAEGLCAHGTPDRDAGRTCMRLEDERPCL